jgi:anaerobic ribonucleoside-triphosphate reductase activating protein
MYYGTIKKHDIANGEGIRTTLFVSGCRNRCPGCFQPETWAFDYGRLFDTEAEKLIFDSMSNPSVRGLTLLGGEPMEPENQRELLPLLRKFKERFPDKTVWLYTGNLYEELMGEVGSHEKALDITAELLSYVDIMVDGRFEEEK